MIILFCSDPLNPKQVDAEYEQEYRTARSMGLMTVLVDLELLLAGDAKSAVKNVREFETTSMAIYRGWMLKPEQYREMYDVLQSKNITLINTPEQYVHCHCLPNSFEHIQSKSVKTKWLSIQDINTSLEEILSHFADRPLIVKDYVKSRKHDWLEACFIPNANDSNQAEKVIRRFIELQAEMLEGGIVLREFVKLDIIGHHPLSNIPLANERRLFFLNHQLIANYDYWDEVIYQNDDDCIPIDSFIVLAKNIDSHFFTMDIAKKKSGEWIVMELGDGQVSGLPKNTEYTLFYERLVSENMRRSR
ncbi:ATP-grasp domain-containing protein (plasmid) [Paenibacillus thiaminolyticus]|uniref:ATP-grasp domain-containing protein n=1 Tax=Paenibacillus thiaminolyticus TaxID=49283 RepID=UPI00232AD0CB|nr:ATP-grasp domain-containing protein [Paenibacillus thiaminolyticus]WCF11562.1 ATP-grasp domain-containing protein [Paenibacillus thiaminolyticus]